METTRNSEHPMYIFLETIPLEALPRWVVNGLVLSSSALVTVFDLIEHYKGAITFIIFFAISITIKSLKAWQEYRHSEERHRQELRQDEEKHQKSLNQNLNS